MMGFIVWQVFAILVYLSSSITFFSTSSSYSLIRDPHERSSNASIGCVTCVSSSKCKNEEGKVVDFDVLHAGRNGVRIEKVSEFLKNKEHHRHQQRFEHALVISIDPQFHVAYIQLGQLKLGMAEDLGSAREVLQLYEQGLSYCKTKEEMKDLCSMKILTQAQVDAANMLKMESFSVQ